MNYTLAIYLKPTRGGYYDLVRKVRCYLFGSYHYVITSCHMFSHSSHVQQQFSCGGMSVAVTMETKHEVFSLLNLLIFCDRICEKGVL